MTLEEEVDKTIATDIDRLDKKGFSKTVTDMSARSVKKWLETQKQQGVYHPEIEKKIRSYYSIYNRIKRLFSA